jgi:16S rRNA (guanine(966)-N(2))-methyltransferase RsmD
MKKELYKQIMAGKYKGKKIKLAPLSTTRSTKSILKESYFNTIQFDIVDRVFFEVFGGSGTMGLEAISRGAKEAFFIEIDKKAYKVLEENIKTIDPLLCKSFLGDSFKLYQDVLNQIDEPTYIYFDPPFDIRENMQDIYEKTIKLIEKTPKEKVELIAIEHLSSRNFPKEIGKFQLKKTKKFGKSSLSYFSTILK